MYTTINGLTRIKWFKNGTQTMMMMMMMMGKPFEAKITPGSIVPPNSL